MNISGAIEFGRKKSYKICWKWHQFSNIRHFNNDSFLSCNWLMCTFVDSRMLLEPITAMYNVHFTYIWSKNHEVRTKTKRKENKYMPIKISYRRTKNRYDVQKKRGNCWNVQSKCLATQMKAIVVVLNQKREKKVSTC